MSLLIATANPAKVTEFRAMLASAGAPEMRDLSQFAAVEVPEETGQTFLANACLKAAHYALATGCWALADDSGLAVDALNGAPGVHSARWAERHARGRGDADNNALLLDQLRDVADSRRTGRFVCALALADPRGAIVLTAQDAVEGQVLRAPRGSNGFGYDPLFLVPSLGRTTAELPSDQKHAISHRGKALRRMNALMQRTGHWSRL